VNWIKALLTAAFVVLAADAYAAACDLEVKPLNFSSYNIFSDAPNEAEGFVTVNCDTAGIPLTVSLDAGVHSGGVFTPRKMKQTTGTATLNYNLYLDAAATRVWGDGTSGTSAWTGTLGGATSGTITIHGRMPANQNAFVGFYSDAVVITVLW